MDAGVIIAIVVGVLILLALLFLLGRKGRQRKLEANRHQAREIRREAERVEEPMVSFAAEDEQGQPDIGTIELTEGVALAA